MEDSVQRRERLKAMRVEADAAEAPHSLGGTSAPPPVHLSNPLVDPIAVQESFSATARFDYYTDPMAIFAGSKRRNIDTQQQPPINCPSPITQPSSPYSSGAQRNFDMNPFSHQHQPTHSPIQRMHQPAALYHGSGSPDHQYQATHSPVQRVHQSPARFQGSGSWRSPSPDGYATPFHGHHSTQPGVWNTSGGPSSSAFPPPPRAGCFPSPSPSQGNYRPYIGRGSGQQFGNHFSSDMGRGGGRSSPRPTLGRGSSQESNNYSPGWGRGSVRDSPRASPSGQRFGYNASPGRGGRGSGRGSHASISARERPDLFYNKSMVEDPWMSLQPTVRNVECWLPKSIRMKKPKISQSDSKFSSKGSQPSLAECLAASLASLEEEEATNDEAKL